MQEFCRICSRADDFRSFVLTTVSQATDVKISDMLVYCTQLEISPDDSLPQRICGDCLTDLNASYAFRKLCHHSDEEFRQLLKNASPEFEFELITTQPVLPNDMNSTQSEQSHIKNEVMDLEDFCDTVVDASAIEDILVLSEPTAESSLDIVPAHSDENSDRTKQKIRKLVKMYLCKECKYSSIVLYNFRRHLNTRRHVAFEVIVTDPSAIPNSRTRRKAPEARCTKRKMYKCEDCGFQNEKIFNFKRHQNVRKHFKFTTFLSEPADVVYKKFVCPLCGDTRASFQSLENHIKTTCVALKVKKLSGILTADESTPMNVSENDSSKSVVIVEPTAIVERDEKGEREDQEGHGTCNRMSGNGSMSTKPFMFKCEFCIFSTPRNYNLLRHHLLMCRDAMYLDETEDSAKYFCDDNKRILRDLDEIKGLRNKLGEPLFPEEYIIENHDTTSSCMPPVGLIDYITEYENCLLVIMRGLRCCGCSLFFESDIALSNHRRKAHRRMKPRLGKDPRKCDDCKIQFRRQDTHEYHNTVGKSDKLFICRICEKVIVSFTAWFSHSSGHAVGNAMRCRTSKNIELLCRKCGDILRTESSLRMHRYNGCHDDQCKLTVGNSQIRWLSPFQCDFCNYSSMKKRGIIMHHSLKCKHYIYLDEKPLPIVMLGDNPLRLITEFTEISDLTFKSGKSLFPAEYEEELYGYSGTFQPPAKLIDSVAVYEFCLVITMRGIRCCGCSMFFDSNTALVEHREIAHKKHQSYENTFANCENCDQCFHQEDSYQHHKRLELSSKLLFCTYCEIIIISNSAWFNHCKMSHYRNVPNRHYETVIVDEKVRCCECQQLCASLEELNAHQIEAHLAERPVSTQSNNQYECQKCLKGFTTSVQLQKHLEINTAKIFYRCLNTECRTEFIHEKEAIVHIDACLKAIRADRSESDFEELSCCFEDCQRSFGNNDDLLVHTDDVHSEQRSKNLLDTTEDYVCERCFEGFPSVVALRQHQFPSQEKNNCEIVSDKKHVAVLTSQVTSDETTAKLKSIEHPSQTGSGGIVAKPVHPKIGHFPCRICRKPHKALTERRMHERNAHGNVKPYKCNYCAARFVFRKTLINHEKEHTEQGRKEEN